MCLEHKKLWKNPVILMILLVGVLANLFLIYRDECERNQWVDVTVENYNKWYGKIQGMQPEEAQEYLAEMLDTDRDTEEGLEYSDYLACSQVAKEIENAGEYDTFLSAREEEQAKKSSFSIFSAKTDEYGEKSANQILEKLRQFAGREIVIAPSRGIRLVFDYFATDLIGILLLFFAAVVTFMQEKERGEHTFIRTCAKGRHPFICRKMGSMFLFAGEVAVLLYAGNLVMGRQLYGLGDLNRWIQSVSGYISSGFEGTVGQAVVVFLLGKWMSYALLLFGFLFLMVWQRSAAGVYLCSLLWLGISNLLYYGIGESSWLSILKNINIIAYLHLGRMLSVYRNINLMGVPVSYPLLFVVTTLAGILFFGILILLLFPNQKIPETASMAERIRYRFRSLAGAKKAESGKNSREKIRVHSLLWQEGRKIFWYQRVFLYLMVFVAFIYMVYSPVKNIYQTEDDIYYKQYIDQIEGKCTAEKVEQVTSWGEKRDALMEQEEQEYAAAKTEEAVSAISSKYQVLLKDSKALDQLIMHTDYLQQVKGGGFCYSRGYEILTGGDGSGNQDGMHGIYGIMGLILCLTGIYGMEYESNMMRLLHTTSGGRRKLHSIKTGYVWLITTLIFCLVYGSWYYSIFSAYGTPGIHVAVNSMEHIRTSFGTLSILGYFILITAMRYLGYLLAAAAICLLSAKTRSYIMTIAISIGIIIVPLLLYVSGIDFMKYGLFNPLFIGNVF